MVRMLTHAAKRFSTTARAIFRASGRSAQVTRTSRKSEATGIGFTSKDCIEQSGGMVQGVGKTDRMLPAMTNMPSTKSAGPASPIKFGTSGWRGLIADDFTFATVRLAVRAIAEHLKSKKNDPTVLVGYDTRFYSEEFSALAVEILQQYDIQTLLCETFTPTPAIAYEIARAKLDGAINFTASHNPSQYHGLKFSGADAGPALPEVTKDIEARVAAILGKDAPFPLQEQASDKKSLGETVNLRANYLQRLNELVRFDVIRKAKLKVVADALHGCGAGYLDKALADHGIVVTARRVNRDCLF